MVMNSLTLPKDFSSKYQISSIQNQPQYTSICGQYCLYFAYKICNGEKMERIIKSMKSPEHVLHFVKINFKFCKVSKCMLFQTCTKC